MFIKRLCHNLQTLRLIHQMDLKVQFIIAAGSLRYL